MGEIEMLPQEPTRSLLIAYHADSSFPEHLIPLGAQLVHSDTNVMCIPLVTDKPIRGYRTDNLVCDDWPVISKEIFDEVMKGFA
jgi:hypothetical protein